MTVNRSFLHKIDIGDAKLRWRTDHFIQKILAMTSLFSNKSKGLLLLVLSLYSLVPFDLWSHFDLGSAVLPFYGAVMTFVIYLGG